MGKTVTTYLKDGDHKGTQYILQHGEVRADYDIGFLKTSGGSRGFLLV